MNSTILLLTLFLIIGTTKSWEFCKSDIKSKICADKGETHIVCDSLEAIPEITHKAEKFLAHVPLTRLVKEAFINWHNYFRNRVASGNAKNVVNSKVFPMSSRMRELVWDRELAFISHHRSKLVVMGKDTCHATQRFPSAGQNIAVKVLDENIPVLEVISEAITEWFGGKNNVDDPENFGGASDKDNKIDDTAAKNDDTTAKNDETTAKDETESVTTTADGNSAITTTTAADVDIAKAPEGETPTAADSDADKTDSTADKAEPVADNVADPEEAPNKFIADLLGEDESVANENSGAENVPTTANENSGAENVPTIANGNSTGEAVTTMANENPTSTSGSDTTTAQPVDAAKPAEETKAEEKESKPDGKGTTEYFTTLVSDRVSRLGCAVALGSNCADSDSVTHSLCYYVVCTYDFDNSGLIYKTTTSTPASECSRWGVETSKTFKNLCGNSGEIFDYTKED